MNMLANETTPSGAVEQEGLSDRPNWVTGLHVWSG